MQKRKKFNLILNSGPSENHFKQHVNDDFWKEKEEETIHKCEGKCQGCGGENVKKGLHLIKGIPEEKENAKLTLLCFLCHATQHIDFFYKKGWIKLVNSIHSQNSIIANSHMNGYNWIKKEMESNNIVVLSKSAGEYIEELKESSLNRNDNIKIIFTEEFDWRLAGKIKKQ